MQAQAGLLVMLIHKLAHIIMKCKDITHSYMKPVTTLGQGTGQEVYTAQGEGECCISLETPPKVQ